MGGLDALVHSAGIYSRGVTSEAPIESFDDQYRINVRAPYRLTQGLIPALRASRGQIVFINSTVVFGTGESVGQFAATQHALRSVADTLRQELNPEGIRVATIFPGRTATPRQERIHEQEERAYAPDRLLQAVDIANLVLTVMTVPTTVEITDVRVRPTLKS